MPKIKTPYKLIADTRCWHKWLPKEERTKEKRMRRMLDRRIRKYFKANSLRYRHLSLKESGRLNSVLSFKSGLSIQTHYVTRAERQSDEWFDRTPMMVRMPLQMI